MRKPVGHLERGTMRRVGGLVASLFLTTPSGPTPPPGGNGPVAGELSGRWEIRFLGLPAGYPTRLVLRLAQHRTRVEGELLSPPGRTFVTGKMLGRFYMVEVRPVVTRGATASYVLELTLDPASSQGLGTVSASLVQADRASTASGNLEMTRLAAPTP